MNRLSLEKRTEIIHHLCEGVSLRATARLANVSFMPVLNLLVEVGTACQKYHDEVVVKVKSQRIQCDEIWSYVYAKQKNVPTGMEDKAGDAWTWVGIDADTKLAVSWLVGNRDAVTADQFMRDVASRLANRVQLTTRSSECCAAQLGSYNEKRQPAFRTDRSATALRQIRIKCTY